MTHTVTCEHWTAILNPNDLPSIENIHRKLRNAGTFMVQNEIDFWDVSNNNSKIIETDYFLFFKGVKYFKDKQAEFPVIFKH